MTFNEFAQKRDEGILNTAWQTAKGAYQGGKQAFGQSTSQQPYRVAFAQSLSQMENSLKGIEDQNLQKLLIPAYQEFRKKVNQAMNQSNQAAGIQHLTGVV